MTVETWWTLTSEAFHIFCITCKPIISRTNITQLIKLQFERATSADGERFILVLDIREETARHLVFTLDPVQQPVRGRKNDSCVLNVHTATARHIWLKSFRHRCLRSVLIHYSPQQEPINIAEVSYPILCDTCASFDTRSFL